MPVCSMASSATVHTNSCGSLRILREATVVLDGAWRETEDPQQLERLREAGSPPDTARARVASLDENLSALA
jgi:hypothetical protein